MVLQIHCAPIGSKAPSANKRTSRGWFFQLIAPLVVIIGVRSAGQIAHNDIELTLLQDKWAKMGVEVDTAVFEFPGKQAPLSWHLTEQEKTQIRDAWNYDEHVRDSVRIVQDFLA
jgi:hypothetical protein